MKSTGLIDAFEPETVEANIFTAWMQAGLFDSKPTQAERGYCIMLPPPNVTGSLHMGHAFQHTLMDALSRYQRMLGKDVLWQPGIDHAGIATQLVVSRELTKAGRDPKQLSREQLLEEIWQWKHSSGSTITGQMKRLGASCDWQRERFTMDESLSKAVIEVFVKLYEQGLIYRGKRMVNWDPVLLTAVSDLEVVAKEEEGVLYHVRYPFVDDQANGVTIATTRPETILVDGAVAVAPGDERFADLVGRKVIVPGTERQIEIITDQHVDPEFGSGCVKITPAHDFNDYEVAIRHPDKNIPVLVLMTPTAHMNDNAPERYRGLDRYEARKLIVEDLREAGLLLKQEPHKYMLPRGDRSNAVVEPMLTDQWFVSAAPLAKKALAAADEGRVKFVPGNWKVVYDNWLKNIHDWCISRQLVWGHRIPAWYDDDGNIFVATDEAGARAACGDDRLLRQDSDVLDTWFSSALWPMSTLGWPNETSEHYQHYFPTSLLVTGFDIIFFWVARMVMMSEHFVGQVPFAEVYVTGLVRDANGQKMSKSKGNILDPIDLIDGISLEDLIAKRTSGLLVGSQTQIAKRTRQEFPEGIAAYGTDALRLTFAALASHGRDIKFDLGRIGGYRHFCNKLWNAGRFVLSVTEDWDGTDGERDFADNWIVTRLQLAERAIKQHFAEYRFDLIVQELNGLFWDDYCDWYIELAKVKLVTNEQAKAATQQVLLKVFVAILRLAHPLIPFVTEELWKHIGARTGSSEKFLSQTAYPQWQEAKVDTGAVNQFEELRELVKATRSFRSELGIDPGLRLDAVLEAPATTEQLLAYFGKLARLGKIKLAKIEAGDGNPILPVSGKRLKLILPEQASDWQQRIGSQVTKLQAELEAVERRLANSSFVNKAPAEVVDGLRQRRQKIETQLQATVEILQTADS